MQRNELYDTLKKLDRMVLENPTKAVEFGKDAYELCKSNNFTMGMALALLRIGTAYSSISKYEEAFPYVFESINLCNENNIKDIKISDYISLGNIFFDIAEYEKSIDYYSDAEKLISTINEGANYYKESSYDMFAAKITNNIGEIYKYLRSYDDALDHYNKAISFEAELDNMATKGISLGNLGEMMYIKGNFEEAIKWTNKAIGYYDLYNNKVSKTEAYRILGLIYEKTGEYEKSEESFLYAINMSKEEGYIYNWIDALIDYGSFLKKRGKNSEALRKLNEAFKLSESNNLYGKSLDSLKEIICIYEELCDTDHSYAYYKCYFKCECRMEYAIRKQRLNSIKVKAKFQEIEKEREVYRNKSEKLSETIDQISIISQLGQKITSTLNLDHILDMMLESVETFVPMANFGIWLYSDESKFLKCYYDNQFDGKDAELPDISIDSSQSIAAFCLRNNELVVINDIKTEYSKYIVDKSYLKNNEENIKLNSAIFTPLIIDNSLVGVMTIQVTEKNAFTPIQVEMIKALSAYAAIAINNAMKSMALNEEVMQRREAQDRLIYLSENDGLTGIANRRKLDKYLNLQWNELGKLHKNLSLIIFDIDCFKQYNDNYGHIEGDNCLVKIAKEAVKFLPKEYFVARYGGDEFVIALPESDLKTAVEFGENFRQRIEKLSITNHYSTVCHYVTVTLGAASIIPSADMPINEFLRQADTALYIAKNKGRNRIVSFTGQWK